MTTGIHPFDRTVQETDLWLEDVEAELGAGRPEAYTGLRAVLHVLRDCLPPAVALRFADHLPVLLRGVFVKGWSLVDKPARLHTVDAFAEAVEAELPPTYPWEGETVARAVLKSMIKHVDLDEASKIVTHVPAGLRSLWAAAG